MIKSTYILILLSSILFLHCSKEEDETSPVDQSLGHSSIVFKSSEENTVKGGKLDFVNQTTGFLLHNNQLHKTIDQGDNWNSLYKSSDKNEYLFIVDFITEQKGIIGGNLDQYAFVLLTENGGLSWDTIYKTPWNVTTLSDVVWANSDKLVLLSPQFFLKSEDSGNHWDTTLSDPFTLDGYFLVDFADKDHGFVISDGYAYSTNNGGDTWSLLTSASFSIPSHLDFIDENRGIITAEKAQLTEDGGKTWSLPKLNDTSIVNALYWSNFVNSTIVYSIAGSISSFGIAKSIDGGKTFDLIQEKWKARNKFYQFNGPIYMLDEDIGFVLAVEKVSNDDLETVKSHYEVLLKTTTGWQ